MVVLQKKEQFSTFTPELNMVTAVVVRTKAFISGFLSITLKNTLLFRLEVHK